MASAGNEKDCSKYRYPFSHKLAQTQIIIEIKNNRYRGCPSQSQRPISYNL